MSFRGMDLERAEQIAAQLEAQVNAINAVVGVVDSTISTLLGVWMGDDVDAFSGSWHHSHRPQARASADQAELWVAELREQIDQQRLASDEGAGPVGGGSGGGLAGAIGAGIAAGVGAGVGGVASGWKGSGSSGWLPHSGDVKGPAFLGSGPSGSWGTNKGGPEGLPSSGWGVRIVEADGKVSIWGADGKLERHAGSVKINADGSVTVLGVDGKAVAKVDGNGLNLTLGGKAVLVGVEGSAEAKLGEHLGVKATGNASVGADAELGVTVGREGVHAGAQAFVGAKAGGDIVAEVGPVKGGASAEVSAGLGVAAEADVGFSGGKFSLEGELGATLGLGGKVGVDIEVDLVEISETSQDIADSIGGWFRR